MVQSRAKRIKNEIQKIKKTLKDLNDCIAEYRERALYISWEEIDWEEIDDEAFWLCTARAEKQKGIEMW